MINFTTLNFLNKCNSKALPVREKNIPSGYNLAPLKCDCVSFTSNRAYLNKSLLDSFDNIEVCEQVHDNADVAEKNLKKLLIRSLGSRLISNNNPHGIIAKIDTRVKSADSIREKIASELEYAITDDQSKIFSPLSYEDIKKTLGDIVGARVTLRKSDVVQTSKIIDALIQEVKAGKLKITNIENYVPKDINPELQYFRKADLIRLQNAVNQNLSYGQKPVELKEQSRRTGYMALHIDVDLSDGNYLVKNNGYKGEIQILGYDVEKLKDVEDLCYKRRQGKEIKAGHVAYNAFNKYFSKHISRTQEFPDLENDFTTYTSKAYLYQRKKDPIHQQFKYRKTKDQLPTIAQCGMTGKIPPELDFNKLQAIKNASDTLYNLTGNI